MSGFKYIIIKTGSIRYDPIIFPEIVEHKNIANALLAIAPYSGGKVVSAGFIRVVEIPGTYGHSQGLNIDSHNKNDKLIINDFHNHAGILTETELELGEEL